MKAKDAMTKDKVITATPKSTILDVINLLIENNISAVPILNDDGTIEGIISEKDLLVFVDFTGRSADDACVEEFMTKRLVVFEEDTPLKDIAAELVRKNIKRAPIVRDNKIVGIVSRRDILKALYRRKLRN